MGNSNSEPAGTQQQQQQSQQQQSQQQQQRQKQQAPKTQTSPANIAGGKEPLPSSHSPQDSTAAPSAPVGKPDGQDVEMIPKDGFNPVAYLEELFEDSGIPVVFRWDKGGNQAFVAGTFDEWKAKIPMSQSGNDFVHIKPLPRGKHGYKMIVDNQWELNKDQPSMVERSGNLINIVDLTNFKPQFENLPDLGSTRHNSPFISEAFDLKYGNRIPDVNEYTKEPPSLPPHLRSIALNSNATPQTVSLDHLYCTARKHGVMVLGVPQKFQNKIITTIYYSPVNGGYPSVVVQRKPSATAAAAALPGSPPAGAAGGDVQMLE